MLVPGLLSAIAVFTSSAASVCFDPTPAFPVPVWTNGVKDLAFAFDDIEAAIKNFISDPDLDSASVSVEVTSSTESLWSYFHTARKQNETRPGTKHVNGDSLYRIASITKAFTTLGLLYQHEARALNLDNPITDYIPELAVDGGKIPFDEITLRTLASQLSGIPREFAQGDLINSRPNPTELGLPPASKEGLPQCDEYADYEPACNRTDLIDWLKKARPLFAPNQQSTYSNINFELIGLALERATGKDYKDYMREAIFEPLNMSLTTIDTPEDDTHAVLPLGDNYWGIDAGVQNPTGGIYSSATDMSKFVRYVLTHYNAVATGVNWLMPTSSAEGLKNFYGMPWEIFKTDRILKESRRAVTFPAKNGGLPGYSSEMILAPEYGLGFTILVGSEKNGVSLLGAIAETIIVGFVQAAEKVIWNDINKIYSGKYYAVDKELNSSLELAASSSSGLVVKEFISNGTDVIRNVIPEILADNIRPKDLRLQLVPTMLFKNESTQQGEIWRATGVYEREDGVDRPVLDEFCVTDLDGPLYAGRPLMEFVFWHREGTVELPAWKVTMAKGGDEDARVVHQV